ncbi:hypothetical protein [Ferrimonas marina]|uniref:Uncharacterized protein n=1 Tax=Ferrimonas marina TaxID=299255 RepID=A0A1M5ZA91_9GAMM|nr:hypothetical protein [Ferrimonas marina]SHI21130.1 hypothetical protein SAMN02745129_0086 [Ferrimonas marina]
MNELPPAEYRQIHSRPSLWASMKSLLLPLNLLLSTLLFVWLVE